MVFPRRGQRDQKRRGLTHKPRMATISNLFILTGRMFNNMSKFHRLLDQSGISRRALAETLGVHYSTVSRWGDDAPQYAIAYLELYAKVQDALK